MAYIETIGPDEADGELQPIYDEARRRSGRVQGLLRLQSLNPPVLAASLVLERAIMRGPSPLSRVEREALAVAVSRVNDCGPCLAAHQAELRAEVERERTAGAADAASAAAFAADIAAQGSEAAPLPRLRALLQFAERLALDPARFEEQHLAPLREAGLDDRAIHDAAQVVGHTSSINRIANGLGLDPDPGTD